MSMYNLLAVDSDAKTVKGNRFRFKTGVMYLVPSNGSGVVNVCPKATEGCRRACLYSAGRGRMAPVQAGRLRKTKLMVEHPGVFREQLAEDIRLLIQYCAKRDFLPAVRINGTSDLPKLALEMADQFPDVQFYDYTKIPKPWARMAKAKHQNYSLTFSYSGENLTDSLAALKEGVNVSVVFDTRKGQPLPSSWHGWPVIDGDLHDLRFIDPSGVVVGLRAKGDAKTEESSFVVKTGLIQIGA